MMTKRRFTLPILLGILVSVFAMMPVMAQDDVQNVPPSDLPSDVRLEGFDLIHQDTNRCSAAALSMQLSFFPSVEMSYHEVIGRLNPYGGDVSVRIEEMGDLAIEQGLNAIVRRGGDIDLLKSLVAAQFPVLIENVYYDGPNGWTDWMSHNRVLVGYDDTLSELYFFDPLLGAGADGRGRPMSYADVDERWQPFNRDFLVIYEAEREAELQAILGEIYWDATANAEHTRAVAQSEIDVNPNNSFAYFNRGWAEVQLELYAEAATSFDEARRIGLPWRMLWYEFGPFEAYLAMERYDDVINLVWSVVQSTDGVEEMYYYIAQAYAGKGDIDRAILNLEAAIYRNRYYQEAIDLLLELKGIESSS